MDAALRYELQAQRSYNQGEPIVITFSIRNLSSHDIWILNWYTPLEGIKGKIFDIKCDGAEIPYEGRLVKRGNPEKDDYVLIDPGASAQAQVDLSQAYSLPACNECVVKFKGRIHDFALDEKQIPRPANQQVTVDVAGNTVSFRIASNVVTICSASRTDMQIPSEGRNYGTP